MWYLEKFFLLEFYLTYFKEFCFNFLNVSFDCRKIHFADPFSSLTVSGIQ